MQGRAYVGQRFQEGMELLGREIDQCGSGGMHDLGQQFVEYLLGRGSHLDEHPTAVVAIGEAHDVAVALKGVEHAGRRTAGDVHACTEGTDGHRPSVPLDDCQRVERGVGQAVSPCDRCHQRLGEASDELELAEDLCGKP